MEIGRREVLVDDVDTNDVCLPDGRRLMQHEESAYENLFTDGRSLDDLGESSGQRIRFEFDCKLHGAGVREMRHVGNEVQSNTFVVQHANVQHSFAYAFTVVSTHDDELLCRFRLFPVDFAYRYPTKPVRGGFKGNMEQPPPKIAYGSLALPGFKQEIELQQQKDGSYSPEMLISHKVLTSLTSNSPTTMHLKIDAEESYFNLGNYVNLEPSISPSPPNSDAIVNEILSGAKPNKSDWVVTVGDGSPRDFHVHGVVLAESSPLIKVALHQHMSSSDNQILMVSHENRMILSKIHSDDMECLLNFIYKRQFVRPKFDAFARVGRFLTVAFRDSMGDFFEHWQAEMVADLRKLDRHDVRPTLSACVKALVAVGSSPPGSLIAAFNVALTVAADSWQMADARGDAEDIKTMLLAEFPQLGIVESILETINDFRVVACGVSKSRV